MTNSKNRQAGETGRRGRARGMLRRLLRDDSGSFVINFAFALPIVLSAIFGTIELGRLGFSKAALQYAAEEATRYAVVREGEVTDQQIEDYAASKLTGVFHRGTAVIAATTPTDPVTGTSRVTVQVTYNYQFLMPFLPSSGIQLTGTSSGFIAFAPGSL